MRPFESISQNQAWLTVFLPALLYYTLLSPTTTPLLSYLNLQPSYAPLNTTIALTNTKLQENINSIFYNDHRRKFEIVILDNNASFYDLTWVEDAELARGYLLVSDSASTGKIWRYETGGGLIPIGKSLYLDQSGCRSNIWTFCNETCTNAGSRGMAIQVDRDEKRFDMGRLMVAERGEKRIVRLEQDGARTPLVLNVPSLCRDRDRGHGREVEVGSRRLYNPGKIMYTPFGDLWFVEEEPCTVPQENNGTEASMTFQSGIYRIKEVVNIPPISFRQSREAHSWTVEDMISKHKDVKVELSYIGAEHISDMIVGKDVSLVYVAASIRNDAQECRIVIYKIHDDDDEEEENEKSNTGTQTIVKDLRQLEVFYDLTNFYPPKMNQCNMYGSALAIDHQGNLYATYPGGLVLLNQDGDLMASIQVVDLDDKDSESSIMTFIEPTALTIGNDGYLYMSTKTMVQRMKVKTKVLEPPTNLIVPKLQ
jgi:hypothetical protein